MDTYHLHLVFDIASFVGVSNTAALVWGKVQSDENVNGSIATIEPADTDLGLMIKHVAIIRHLSQIHQTHTPPRTSTMWGSPVNGSIATIEPADTDLGLMIKLHVWFVDFSAAVSPANEGCCIRYSDKAGNVESLPLPFSLVSVSMNGHPIRNLDVAIIRHLSQIHQTHTPPRTSTTRFLIGCPFIETDTKENGKGKVQSDENVNGSIATIALAPRIRHCQLCRSIEYSSPRLLEILPR
jgi:hypothetical protein